LIGFPPGARGNDILKIIRNIKKSLHSKLICICLAYTMIEIKDIEGFEWDTGNNQKNFLKHSFSDREAEEVFNSHPFIVLRTAYLNEERFQMFGESKQRLLTIIFTIRKNKIRIISAGDMSKKERTFYEHKLKEEVKANPGL